MWLGIDICKFHSVAKNHWKVQLFGRSVGIGLILESSRWKFQILWNSCLIPTNLLPFLMSEFDRFLFFFYLFIFPLLFVANILLDFCFITSHVLKCDRIQLLKFSCFEQVLLVHWKPLESLYQWMLVVFSSCLRI